MDNKNMLSDEELKSVSGGFIVQDRNLWKVFDDQTGKLVGIFASKVDAIKCCENCGFSTYTVN